jgi:hypothetical protein
VSIQGNKQKKKELFSEFFTQEKTIFKERKEGERKEG